VIWLLWHLDLSPISDVSEHQPFYEALVIERCRVGAEVQMCVKGVGWNRAGEALLVAARGK
jgi:hypothetical protein